jgi:hypothetical protein
MGMHTRRPSSLISAISTEQKHTSSGRAVQRLLNPAVVGVNETSVNDDAGTDLLLLGLTP